MHLLQRPGFSKTFKQFYKFGRGRKKPELKNVSFLCLREKILAPRERAEGIRGAETLKQP